MSDLSGLKKYWLTSMTSIIRRAKDLGCINADRYKFLSIEMSRNGLNKNDGVVVPIDKPTCFKNAVELFKNELSYSEDDFMNFTALPIDILRDIMSFNNDVRLRVIRDN
jgi:hypothetical protein